MKYLLLICSDGHTSDEDVAVIRANIDKWVDEMDRRGVRLLGKPLDEPAAAKTVRVRDGQALTTDGPFVESKEYVAGLDVLECADLDEAIQVAAKHPMSWFHSIEVRAFADGLAINEPHGDDDLRYLMMVTVDGVPEAPEVEEQLMRDGNAWRDLANEREILILGHPLQHRDTATTVRVRDGEVLLTDGPFAESKEFLAGICILNCATLDQAVHETANHPLAHYHPIEVRPFVTY